MAHALRSAERGKETNIHRNEIGGGSPLQHTAETSVGLREEGPDCKKEIS